MRAPLLLVPALLFALGSCGKDADAGQGSEAGQGAEAAPAQVESEIGCLGDCDSEGEEHADHADHADHGPGKEVDFATLVKKADPKGSYGMGVTLEEFTKVSDILAKPAEFEGKRVKVQGEAVGVCSSRGCWVELKGDQPYQSIKIKVDDGEIVFPMSCKGTVVVAEGVLEKQVYPVETHRSYLAKKAKAKGEDFDPESVTTELVIWQIRGLGATIEG